MKSFSEYLDEIGEIGYVEEVIDSLVYANGLPCAMPHEIIVFETGEFGQVLSLGQETVEVLVFSRNSIRVGTKVTRTNNLLGTPVGPELLGQTIDPLGYKPDGTKAVKRPKKTLLLDMIPSGIATRYRIRRPLQTGINLVDLIIPLGKGQRELVIGDRKSGKTNFIIHSILSQSKLGDVCIYAAIGKKRIDIKKIEEFFKRNGIMENIVIVATSPQDPSSIIYLTPYTAMAIAEYFKDEGRDTLIVFDDLSSHAKFYREIALLGKRFPGRNSYPGDIFHIHSKLLERAGNFMTEKGEVAITCLPIVETIQGDLTGYIQTNIMSMTDGHIYFDSDLFSKGRRPAINPFLSVTRVGHQAQSQLRREISRELISFLTLYEKVQSYVHFGAEMSESLKNTLFIGDRLLFFFDQPLYKTNPINLQLFIFCILWSGAWNQKDMKELKHEIEKAVDAYNGNEKVQGKINRLIENYVSFNKLLGDIQQNKDAILAEIDLLYHEGNK